MHRHRRDLDTISEMNLTNLIDTAFILVITFLLVAPSIKNGIKIEMPGVAAPSLATNSHTVTIVIAKPIVEGGEEPIYIEGDRKELDEMARDVQDKQALYPELDILIEADKGSTCDTYAKVMAKLNEIGVKSVGFETTPPENETPPKTKPKRSSD